MLKSDLIRPRLIKQGERISTRPIPVDYHYLDIANALVKLFQASVGSTRAHLAETLREFEGDSLEYPVIRGLAAVLETRCTFATAAPDQDNACGNLMF